MKKVFYLIAACAVIASAASCEKINDLVTGKTTNEQGLVDDNGKKLSVNQQESKVEETADILMANFDVEVWKGDYELVMNTYVTLSQKEIDGSVVNEKLNQITDLWTSVSGEDPNEVATTIVKLSDLKGHFTENAEGVMEYEEAKDLQITVLAGEDKVTATFSVEDSAPMIKIYDGEKSKISAYVPSLVNSSLSIGANTIAKLKVQLNPVDKNGDGILDEKEDRIDLTYKMDVSAYTLEVSRLAYASEKATVSAKLSRGKQLLVGIDAGASYKWAQETYGEETYETVNPESGYATLDLAGKMQFRGNLPDYNKVQEATRNMSEALYGEVADEAKIREAVQAYEDAFGFGVYYDGKNTLQATLGFEPIKYIDGEYSRWTVDPVIRFADGTSMGMEELSQEQDIQRVAEKIQNWILGIQQYLGIGQEQPEQLK